MLKKILLGILLVVLLISGALWGKPIYTRVVKFVIPGPKIVMGSPKEFTVNLVDPNMKRYLRVMMTFKYLEKKALVNEFDARDPEVRDAIIGVLRSKTVAELVGTETTEQLRTELVTAINSVLSTGEVIDLYFIEFVIQ
ncbi:MAG: flagellar FliL protein [Bacillota bacterium]|nr:MAG: flagellar FliL protein [Bacillota bacterium]MBS3951259.1 flagellar basal body-associated FliL family protein [Peptococcaceae bacterium]